MVNRDFLSGSVTFVVVTADQKMISEKLYYMSLLQNEQLAGLRASRSH
jgi:hypothetical protein